MADRIIRETSDLDSDGSVTAGDSIYFDRGEIAVTNNQDSSDVNDLVNIRAAFSWRGNIGTQASPFKAGVSGYFEYNAGGGTCWYEAKDLSATNTCALLRVNGSTECTLNATGTGTLTVAENWSGRLNVGGGVPVPTLRVGEIGQCYLDRGAQTSATTIEVGGGRLESRRGATTWNQFGNSTVLLDAVATASTTYNLYGGSLMLMNSGAITTINWYGGEIVPELSRPIAITTINVWGDRLNIARVRQHPLVFGSGGSGKPTFNFRGRLGA